MTIYNIVIEPLEERYSVQWAQWWKDEFNKSGYTSENITGDETLTSKVETGSFLDAHSTIHWKSSQIMKLAKLLKDKVIVDGDVLFFHDLWFPGLEGLGYIRDLSGVNFKIAGYLHAGAYDPADLLHQVNMQRWVTGCERSWVALADYIFVGSEYHKELLEALVGTSLTGKVHPIGYPVDKPTISEGVNVVPFKDRDDIVVFPHRLDSEKNPHIFDALASRIPEAKFVKSKEVCNSKKEYYSLLAKAKVSVSTADQETFGIAMVESALLGCVPVAPNKLSYKDTMPEEWRYDFISELEGLVRKALQLQGDDLYDNTTMVDKYSLHTVVKRVIEIMLNNQRGA